MADRRTIAQVQSSPGRLVVQLIGNCAARPVSIHVGTDVGSVSVGVRLKPGQARRLAAHLLEVADEAEWKAGS